MLIDIKFGKSGEIVMSLYSSFASQLKEVNAELLLMKKNISSWEYDNTMASSTMSTSMSMTKSKSMSVSSKTSMKTSQKNVAAAKLEYDCI